MAADRSGKKTRDGLSPEAKAFEELLAEQGLSLRGAASAIGVDYHWFRRMTQGRFATIPSLEDMARVSEPFGLNPIKHVFPIHLRAVMERAGLPAITPDKLVFRLLADAYIEERISEGARGRLMDLEGFVRRQPPYLVDWTDDAVDQAAKMAEALRAEVELKAPWERDLLHYDWLVELSGGRSGFQPSPLGRAGKYNSPYHRAHIYLFDDNPRRQLSTLLRAEKLAVSEKNVEWLRKILESAGEPAIPLERAQEVLSLKVLGAFEAFGEELTPEHVELVQRRVWSSIKYEQKAEERYRTDNEED